MVEGNKNHQPKMCWLMNWKWVLISCVLPLPCCSPGAASDSFFFIKKKKETKTFKGVYKIFSVIISKIKTPKKLPSHRNLVNLLVLWMKDTTEILNIYCSCAKWPCTFHLNCTIIHQPSLLCLSCSPCKNFRCHYKFLLMEWDLFSLSPFCP